MFIKPFIITILGFSRSGLLSEAALFMGTIKSRIYIHHHMYNFDFVHGVHFCIIIAATLFHLYIISVICTPYAGLTDGV